MTPFKEGGFLLFRWIETRRLTGLLEMNFLFLLAALSASPLAQETNPAQSMFVIPSYRDEWKLIEVKSPDSGEVWLFRKNLGASEIKGLKQLPTLVYFTVQFAPYDVTGLPDEEDAKALYDFEEKAIPSVEKDAVCIHVASVVKGGMKDHLFYVSNADLFIQVLNRHREPLKKFKVSLEKHDDPKWEIYEDFPGGN